MAVKKASAKKPVKKAVAKKAVAKKAVKKAPAKPIKKTVAKKAVKKAPAKKVAKKVAAKSPIKKTATKSVKKSVAKKTPTKKLVTKSATKKSAVKTKALKKQVLKFDVPEVPVIVPASRLEVMSTPAPVIAPSAPKPSQKASGPSSRVVLAVVIGIIILVAIVWGRSGKNSDDAMAKPSTTATLTADPSSSASASDTPSSSASATPSATATTIAAHEAPQGIVAHYTKTGATIFWSAPAATDGLTGYNVEISVGGSAWKTISTVPATQLTQDVKKNSASSWTSFKVSSVYSDAMTTPGKVFGLPGTFS